MGKHSVILESAKPIGQRYRKPPYENSGDAQPTRNQPVQPGQMRRELPQSPDDDPRRAALVDSTWERL